MEYLCIFLLETTWSFAGGRKLYVPRVEDKNSHMRMLHISRIDDLVANSMDILEPAPVDADGNAREDGTRPSFLFIKKHENLFPDLVLFLLLEHCSFPRNSQLAKILCSFSCKMPQFPSIQAIFYNSMWS